MAPTLDGKPTPPAPPAEGNVLVVLGAIGADLSPEQRLYALEVQAERDGYARIVADKRRRPDDTWDYRWLYVAHHAGAFAKQPRWRYSVSGWNCTVGRGEIRRDEAIDVIPART